MDEMVGVFHVLMEVFSIMVSFQTLVLIPSVYLE